jgi:hypothetical protein
MVSLVTPLPECADVVKRQKVLMKIAADSMQKTFVFMIPSRFSFMNITTDYQ